MVSDWVPLVNPVADAVMVGVPALVSPYQKFVVLFPELIDTEVVGAPFCVVENTALPAVFEDRFTVIADVVALPKASCSCTVIGPRLAEGEAVPDTAALVMTSLEGAAATIVSTCVELPIPLAAAVIVGVPTLVSPYQKVVYELPAPMLTDEVAVPFWVAENTPVPASVDDRLTMTAVAPTDGFPKGSSSCTRMGPRLAVDDAGPLAAKLVIATLVGADAEIVSCWVPLVKAVAAAVMVGVPALVSPYQKVAELLPDGMDTEVVGVPFLAAEKTAVPLELEESVTVSADLVGLSNWSRSCTVMGPKFAVVEVVPDTGLLVMTNWEAAPVLVRVNVAPVRPLLVACTA
jgi:hypothetical protein